MSICADSPGQLYNADWRAILGKPKLDKHQRDVELLLRVFAMFDRSEKYEKPMKEFLNQTMKEHIAGKTPKFLTFASLLPVVAKAIKSQLPPKPFHVRGPVNLAVLDSVTSVLISGADKIPTDLGDRFKRLLADEKFKSYVFFSTSDTVSVKSRIEIARKYLLN